MQSTMMREPLSTNHFLERAGKIFPTGQIVSRLPDKSLVSHTYADFYRRSRQLAAGLQALGISKGERVATLCWNHHVHLECYFGIPAMGAVMHTLNLRLSPSEIAWIVNDAQDSVLIIDDILLPLYAQFADQVSFEQVIVFNFSRSAVAPAFANLASLDYEELLARAPANFGYAEHDENDAIAACYTSGTTGRPKGVVYSHRSAVLHTLVASLSDFWGLQGRDVVLPVTPMFHANCWGIPYGAVMMGAKLVFPGPHLGAHDLLDLMQLEPPTLSLGVPTIWLSVIQTFEANPGKWQMPVMRSLVGGAAVPEALIRAFARNGVSIVQGWGMTETSPLATVSYLKSELRGISDDEQFRRKSMAGVPAPLVSIRIIGEDENGTALTQEQVWDGIAVGEIQVRGPFITGEYYSGEINTGQSSSVASDSNPSAFDNATKFTADGWLRTGDVATIDPHGYLRITDRTKDLIKSGGEWISSVDLENALMGHSSIAEAAVIAVPDDKWSERPIACVVLKAGDKVTSEQLQQLLLAKGFAKWQLPDRYEWITQVPKTSTGKFWKAKLREQFPK